MPNRESLQLMWFTKHSGSHSLNVSRAHIAVYSLLHIVAAISVSAPMPFGRLLGGYTWTTMFTVSAVLLALVAYRPYHKYLRILSGVLPPAIMFMRAATVSLSVGWWLNGLVWLWLAYATIMLWPHVLPPFSDASTMLKEENRNGIG